MYTAGGSSYKVYPAPQCAHSTMECSLALPLVVVETEAIEWASGSYNSQPIVLHAEPYILDGDGTDDTWQQ